MYALMPSPTLVRTVGVRVRVMVGVRVRVRVGVGVRVRVRARARANTWEALAWRYNSYADLSF